MPVIRARVEQLAIETESVDLVLAHHILDFCQDPYQALRETSRVLLPGGYLVCISFNPFSSWGVRALLQYVTSIPPFNGRFIGFSRLNDWLQLLELEVVERHSVGYALPLTSIIDKSWLRKLFSPLAHVFPAVAAVNITVARKKKPGMIFGAEFKKRQVLKTVGSVTPSPRQQVTKK